MPRDISYSNGSVVKNAVVEIWEDMHTERRGIWYRAFWTNGPVGATSGSPVFGYCDSLGGPHRTIKAAAAEVRKYYPGEPVYRNGRAVAL
jgi:hypothetical protein